MLVNDERQQRIDRIRRFPAELTALVEPLSDSQLNTQTIPGEWTVQQIVHHLPDSHMNSVIRLKRMLTEDNPTLRPYDQDAWAETPDVFETSITASLAILTGLHERWTNLLDALSDEQRARTGHHLEIGTINADDLVVIYSDHCDEHIDQIERVLAAYKDEKI